MQSHRSSGLPRLARVIKDVDLALKALEIVYLENGAEVEKIADINGHRSKEVGEGGNGGGNADNHNRLLSSR